jgi:small subunit ribosomal protein S7
MRRAPAEVRKIEPDPVYRSVLVSQVINKVLWRGKKGAARRIVYGSLETVQKRTG